VTHSSHFDLHFIVAIIFNFTDISNNFSFKVSHSEIVLVAHVTSLVHNINEWGLDESTTFTSKQLDSFFLVLFDIVNEFWVLLVYHFIHRCLIIIFIEESHFCKLSSFSVSELLRFYFLFNLKEAFKILLGMRNDTSLLWLDPSSRGSCIIICSRIIYIYGLLWWLFLNLFIVINRSKLIIYLL